MQDHVQHNMDKKRRPRGIKRGVYTQYGTDLWEQYFWARVEKTNGCWNWTGACLRQGHGTLTWRLNATRTKSAKAHRIAWQLLCGPIAKGKLVLHHCDNAKCVNPKHLYLGSHADNIRDAVTRRRLRPSKGQQHYKTTLSTQDVRAIKNLLLSGERQITVARRYNISRANIHFIATGKTWGHVNVEDN